MSSPAPSVSYIPISDTDLRWKVTGQPSDAQKKAFKALGSEWNPGKRCWIIPAIVEEEKLADITLSNNEDTANITEIHGFKIKNVDGRLMISTRKGIADYKSQLKDLKFTYQIGKGWIAPEGTDMSVLTNLFSAPATATSAGSSKRTFVEEIDGV